MEHYYYWQSKKNKKWYWHRLAVNGRILADSGQGYTRKWNLLRTLKHIRAMPTVPILPSIPGI